MVHDDYLVIVTKEHKTAAGPAHIDMNTGFVGKHIIVNLPNSMFPTTTEQKEQRRE